MKNMASSVEFLVALYFMSCVAPGIGFAPSIDLPTTTPEPTSTTPDPATLPFFPDARDNSSLTVTAGRAAVLPCRVLRLGDRMVSWVKKEGDKLRLITFGTNTYVNNKRYSLFHDNPDSWELVISPVTEEDSGVYACQVSIHPPMQFAIHLYVTVPILSILDDRNTAIHEKFYEVGSSVVLQCRGTHLPPETLPVWAKSDSSRNFRQLADDVTGSNSSWSDGESVEMDPVVWLKISSASKGDSGNYSCSAPDTTPAYVRVHVVEGEDSVAMQHSTNDASLSQGTPRVMLLLALLYILTLLVSIGLPFNTFNLTSFGHPSKPKITKTTSNKKILFSREVVSKIFKENFILEQIRIRDTIKNSSSAQTGLGFVCFMISYYGTCCLGLSKDFRCILLISPEQLYFSSEPQNVKTEVIHFRYRSKSISNENKINQSAQKDVDFNLFETNEISAELSFTFSLKETFVTRLSFLYLRFTKAVAIGN